MIQHLPAEVPAAILESTLQLSSVHIFLPSSYQHYQQMVEYPGSEEGSSWLPDTRCLQDGIGHWGRPPSSIERDFHSQNQNKVLGISSYQLETSARIKKSARFWQETYPQAAFGIDCQRQCSDLSARGATRMARGGIRLVHRLTKGTLITYFSGLKKDPKYTFLHAFFLICLSCSFQNLSKWRKTHPFFQFFSFLHP